MDTHVQRHIHDAVAHFWKTRDKQRSEQGRIRGEKNVDRGSRSAVTGGRQLDGFVNLFRFVFTQCGLDPRHIHVERRATILPGYFRATKEWDIVVIHNEHLLATIECKSQVGPSFGNNFNNRSEEAIGSAHDLWTAFREGAFRTSPRPWLGYLMLLEDCESSRKPVSVDEPHFPAFREFHGASYAKRYEILCKRLIRERLYDAACLLFSTQIDGIQGKFEHPSEELGISRLIASITAHVASHARYVDDAPPQNT